MKKPPKIINKKSYDEMVELQKIVHDFNHRQKMKKKTWKELKLLM